VIPGYQGFVPGLQNSSIIGKTYTETTREALRKEKLDDRRQFFSSTG
jgi:hypothetical protein